MTTQTDLIGERLKLARQIAGLSQADAANVVGVREKTIGRWERGQSAGFLEVIDRIAEAYGTTREQILGDTMDDAERASLEVQVTRLTDEVHSLVELLTNPELLRERADALDGGRRRK